jgi:hypothetical protein
MTRFRCFTPCGQLIPGPCLRILSRRTRLLLDPDLPQRIRARLSWTRCCIVSMSPLILKMLLAQSRPNGGHGWH